MIIAIDFDGTIVMDAHPKIGPLIPDAAKYITRLYNEGHEIIINSCRTGIYEGNMMLFLKEHGIPYHYINCNMPHKVKSYGMDCRKISADVYIDDRQLGGLPKTWKQIYKTLKSKHK